jgi:hypothetical protein
MGTFILVSVGIVVIFGTGFFLGYKYGSKLKAEAVANAKQDLSSIKSGVDSVVNKAAVSANGAVDSANNALK